MRFKVALQLEPMARRRSESQTLLVALLLLTTSASWCMRRSPSLDLFAFVVLILRAYSESTFSLPWRRTQRSTTTRLLRHEYPRSGLAHVLF